MRFCGSGDSAFAGSAASPPRSANSIRWDVSCSTRLLWLLPQSAPVPATATSSARPSRFAMSLDWRCQGRFASSPSGFLFGAATLLDAAVPPLEAGEVGAELADLRICRHNRIGNHAGDHQQAQASVKKVPFPCPPYEKIIPTCQAVPGLPNQERWTSRRA